LANLSEIELALIGSIKSESDLVTARQAGLEPEDFADDTCKRVYQHLLTYEIEDRPFPSREDKQTLYDIELPEQNFDVTALAGEIHKAGLGRRVRTLLMRYNEDLDESPSEVISMLVTDLGQLRGTAKRTSYLEPTALLRFEELERRAKAAKEGRLIGWPMGYPAFETGNMGVQPGEFITIIGKSGVGKSWLLANSVATAYRAGAKVLYLSPEMTAFETEMRVDVLNMYANGYTADHEGLMSGNEKAMKSYRDYINALNIREDWITVDSDTGGGFNSNTITDIVMSHRPDILAIDGFNLLAGSKSGGNDEWQGIKRNADAIKVLGNTIGMSTITVMQAIRNVSIYTNPGQEHIAYGKALYEASDRVYGLAKVRGKEDERSIKEEKRRGRQGNPYRVYLKFDVNIGKIQQLRASEVGGDEDEESDF